jgi:hypothetical protein
MTVCALETIGKVVRAAEASRMENDARSFINVTLPFPIRDIPSTPSRLAVAIHGVDQDASRLMGFYTHNAVPRSNLAKELFPGKPQIFINGPF